MSLQLSHACPNVVAVRDKGKSAHKRKGKQMSRKSHAVEIEAGVNLPVEQVAPNCKWSHCPDLPAFLVEHPILGWVQTCRNCVEDFLKTEVEDVTEQYRGSFWELSEQ